MNLQLEARVNTSMPFESRSIVRRDMVELSCDVLTTRLGPQVQTFRDTGRAGPELMARLVGGDQWPN